MAVGGLTRAPDHRRIEHRNGVWIEPCLVSLLADEVGEHAKVAGVTPSKIPGYWQAKLGHDTPTDARAEPGERVVLFLHGGAYITASAHPNDPISAALRDILRQTKSLHRAFSIEYRLSSRLPDGSPLNAYPAPLIDALSGYIHLLRLGFTAKNIIICGDSAGGNLAHALTRYLLENQAFLETKMDGIRIRPPSGLIMLSPWVDLGSSHDEPIPPYFNRPDFLWTFEPICAPEKWAQRTYTGRLGLGFANTSRYVSPASKFIDDLSFAGFPRTLLSWGGVEAIKPCILTLKERMSTYMADGNGLRQLTCLEVPDAVHDFTVIPWMEPERTETLKAVAQWIDHGA